MVLFNYSTKELTAKVVYYGPALCGKTSNLQWIHEKLPIKNKGKMLSLATETDRTLFFDFLPIEIGTIRGMRTRIQLYTVPGQVFYNATRRMVLKGADAVVFVCDSQEDLLDANLDSLENMRQNLEANEIDPDEIPTVMQYNKRDLPNALPIEMLNERLNGRSLPFYEAVAPQGTGVEATLKAVTKLVFRSLSARYGDPSVSSPGISTTPARPVSAPELVTPGPLAASGNELLTEFALTPAPPAATSPRAPTPPPAPARRPTTTHPPATGSAPPLAGPRPSPPAAAGPHPSTGAGARPPAELTLPTPTLHAGPTPPPSSSLGARLANTTLVSTAAEADELRRRIARPMMPVVEDLDLEEIEETDTSPLPAADAESASWPPSVPSRPPAQATPRPPSIPPRPPVLTPEPRPPSIPPRPAALTPDPPSREARSAGPAEVEVPVEIHVAPGTTQINLRLKLAIKIKPKL